MFVCVFSTGDFVAQIKFTVLLMPNGSDKITSHTLQELQPTKTIDDPEIKGWLALGIKKKKGGGKKKKGMNLNLQILSVEKKTYIIPHECFCSQECRRGLNGG